MKFVAKLFFALLLFSPAPAFGQIIEGSGSVEAISLPDLYKEIRANNPSLRAARLETDALSTRNRQSSTLPDPTVMITFQPFPLYTARGTQRSQWRVEQMIPFPGKLGLAGEIADRSADISGFEMKTLGEDLFHQVKVAYYELYRIQQQERLIRDFQNQLEDFEAAAAIKYQVGSGLQQAILKAQLEKNSLSRMLIILSQQRQSAAESMTRLLNRSTPTSFGDIRLELPPLPDADEAALLAVALDHRPEVDALNSAALRAELQVKLAQKQFLPDIGFNVTYFDVGSADVPPTATGRDALALGVSLKVPLQRRRLNAAVEESQVRQNQIRARQEALDTAFRTQIRDLLNRLKLELEQLALYDEGLIPQAETTLEATLSSYTTGRTDFLDLLDAQRMLFSLRTSYEDTVANYLKDSAALERTLGLESLQDLINR
jgi:outer membrane protein TolC